uniref:C2H2-type domain-containing protein n=1 Tax=Glossina pallidipes TaxID=7398 RepID=A0A1A9ZEA2_GLOPL
MVKNIQCPVCTLYLHAGMNLCDHLETHPKEQVIKALVEMTISGNENRLLTTQLMEETKNIREKERNSAEIANNHSPPIKDHDVSSNCSISASISSLSNQSSNHTHTTLSNAINFGESNATDGCSTFSLTSSKTAIKFNSDSGSDLKNPLAEPPGEASGEFIKQTFNQSSNTNINQVYQSQTTTMLSNVPTDFSIFGSQRYQHAPLPSQQNSGQSSTTGHLHAPTQLVSSQHHVQYQEYTRGSLPQNSPTQLPILRAESISSGTQQSLNSIAQHLATPSKRQILSLKTETKNGTPTPSPVIRSQHSLPQDKHLADQQTNVHAQDSNGSHTKPGSGLYTTSNSSTSAQPSLSTTTSASNAGNSIFGRSPLVPYPILLSSATSTLASSATSVLRYAESPVAHYLERENGDFIVQETPKHVMEYVEEEDGEFSVIERIYQSPPSVLHIHDEDDVDGDVSSKEALSPKVSGNKSKSFDNEQKSEKVDNSDNEEDFMSISGESDQEEFVASNHPKSKKPGVDSMSKQSDVSLTNETETLSISKITPSTNASSPLSQDSIRKKSPKNTITVLSDVQLNLNEYLDLVGNIIASSKISPQRKTLSAIAPVPLVKIEKEEPLDDDEDQIQEHSTDEGTSTKPPLKADKHETEKPTDTSIQPTEEDEKKPDIFECNIESDNSKCGTPYSSNCSGHATSVIRMATTSTSQQMQQTSHVNDGLLGEGLLVKQKEKETVYADKEPKSITIRRDSDRAEDLSKPQPKIQHNLTGFTSDYLRKPFATAIGRKVPKKLVIKPKSSKTEISATNACASSPTGDDQKPSTSAKAQEEYAKLKQRISTDSSNETTPLVQQKGMLFAQLDENYKERNRCNKTADCDKLQLKSSREFDYIEDNEREQLSVAEKLSNLSKTTTIVEKEINKSYASAEKCKRLEELHQHVIMDKRSNERPTLATTNSSNLTPTQDDREKRVKKNLELISFREHGEGLKQKQRTIIEDIVKVKSEPLSGGNYENQLPETDLNIVDQQLECSSAHTVMECKEEKPCLTETCLPSSTPHLKTESNIADDARVLYDFANSKKVTATETSRKEFLSSSVAFSKQKMQDFPNSSNIDFSSAQSEKENKSEMVVINSSYSSESAVDVNLQNCSFPQSSSVLPFTNAQPNQAQNYIDYPFGFLYNSNNSNNNHVSQQEDIKRSQTFYSNMAHSVSVSNSSNSNLLEDSSATKQDQSLISNQQHNQNRNVAEWFNSTDANNTSSVSTAVTSNIEVSFNSPLSVDCNASLDGGDVSKYLDLDACKREQNFDIIDSSRSQNPPQPPPSSPNSCSFAGATDNSLSGVCPVSAALNIRTDEKMPAKGEISEQESNCDIENSWSQPMYGDISARFFRTSFPGMFTHDSDWHHEDYFTVQDLSASTTAPATNGSSRTRSFDLRLPSETTSAVADNFISSGLQIFSQNSQDNIRGNADILPSTSGRGKKKRKRISQDDKLNVTTSLTQVQHIQETREPESTDFELPQASAVPSSSEFLAGPVVLGDSALVQNLGQQKPREKTYECARCFAKYSKLKDRNAHMIAAHNYVRQNRKLVCPQTIITSTITSNEADVTDLTPSTSEGVILSKSLQIEDLPEDSKHGIVKIETEPHAADVNPVNNDLVTEMPKELDDNKQNVSIVPVESSYAATESNVTTSIEKEEQTSTLDIKYPGLQRLSLNAPTTKLTTLYRMLVTYNMSNLKIKQDLTELDEKLMESLIFYCHVCRQSFSSVKFYDIHLTEHPAECFSCGKKFQRWKNLSLHLKRHMGWKEFGCNVCEKKFVVRSALVEHMRMHSGQSPLKCKICGKHFKRYSNLTQHRKRHTKQQLVRKKEYVCYCGEVLPSKARFLWHKETHDSKPKCCPHCCDRFVHVNSLKRHIRLAHSDKFDYVEPMECPICKQVFSKASMKSHMATHSTESQYDCTICSKSFSTKWNLKIHSWVHANRTAKPFKCEHCPKAFVRELDFKNHINSHKQIRPYTCEVCGCKFIRKYNYMRHRREHHGDKKFTCQICKKSFHRHYYLIEHMRIHTGERPFQCTICGKSSTTKTNHNKHMKIHHSRDPFTVEV